MSLTPRSFLIAGLVLLAGVVGQWAGGAWQDLWRYPAALFILLILTEGLVARARDFTVERRVVDKLPLGQSVAVSTRVHNPTQRGLKLQTEPRYPVWLRGESEMRSWLVRPGEVSERHETITVTQLGPHTLGNLYMRILGRWGLAWWARSPLAGSTVEGIPCRLDHGMTGIATGTSGEKPMQRVAASGHDLVALRDYQSGDPPRSIDWKATARARKPMVRIYTEERRMDLVLVVDAGRSSRLQAGRLTRLGHYVNVAARLAELAVAEGDRVAMVSFAGERLGTVPLAGGAGGLRRVRHHLERLRSQPKDFNPLTAVLYLRGMLRHRSLVVLLTEVEDNEAAGQLFNAVRLLVPKHSPLIASLLDEPIEDLKMLEPRHWLDPYRTFAAMEYTHARLNTVLHLRRLGADVVTAAPDRLDPAVLGRYQQLRLRHRV